MCGDNDVISIDYDEIVTSTPDAILFSIEDKNIWISRSQIEDHDEDDKYFAIPEWLAFKKELI